MMPAPVFLSDINAHYHTLLLDAYGVLVNAAGALPGAAALLAYLDVRGQPYYILSNAASRAPEALARAFAKFGLAIPAARIITSGSLLAPYFAEQGLSGLRFHVLGPAPAWQYAHAAGAKVVDYQDEAEGLIIADQAGFPVFESMDAVLSQILKRLDASQPTPLILCNPDLIYPLAKERLGFTAGGLAAMFEAVLQERYGDDAPRFVRLGKPYRPIFEIAATRAATRDLLMVGDQLHTDILGAHNFGIDAALVLGGVSAPKALDMLSPRYLIKALVAPDMLT
jgi:HAD superfamily hydrolase (TIGR01450 family)